MASNFAYRRVNQDFRIRHEIAPPQGKENPGQLGRPGGIATFGTPYFKPSPLHMRSISASCALVPASAAHVLNDELQIIRRVFLKDRRNILRVFRMISARARCSYDDDGLALKEVGNGIGY